MAESKVRDEQLKGVFARSMAGHDKGMIYVIQEWDSDTVMLVNGKNRTMQNPKKKKRKHVQIHGNQSVCTAKTDQEIRKAIKAYQSQD